ncbi:hypothetical protein CERSUDRAFT_110097 [Gelatoporia subvermispora B]|uniref:Uncharacterized protein n=1 Tax=Ceriporiopsis subvermispora (strain B) TaxID=914234 RepID=M2RRM8_CERS8|nr:hypothetical protein CERSUDRAFT_110097 [Gelatoporia subvermispora B]
MHAHRRPDEVCTSAPARTHTHTRLVILISIESLVKIASGLFHLLTRAVESNGTIYGARWAWKDGGAAQVEEVTEHGWGAFTAGNRLAQSAHHDAEIRRSRVAAYALEHSSVVGKWNEFATAEMLRLRSRALCPGMRQNGADREESVYNGKFGRHCAVWGC